ncbi:uncharacterized protein F4807DRAFT_443435 [Annulohypoxylon truncatum]|uniref:uncharacterized protein n=1 Tax=Annulohypoxylon truncatum TaxID=327061 RepID=UPI002007EC48|nr:uncharacterized protein F4807DRAFT_443435 [Annulohypoxylon truncatum]KAI1205278.1 hypothetical protein F4807DRAFT_443435 [Annulohypoxylon truncatum]
MGPRIFVWNSPKARRQLHLGPSVNGTLKIVDLPIQDDRSVHRSKPFDKLPDELIQTILEFAFPSSEATDYRTALALTLTCRRLYRLATPFLYNHLHFQLPFSNHSNALMRMNPANQVYCRKLNIACSDMHGAMTDEDWVITTAFLTKFSKTRSLVIHGGFTRHGIELWPLTSKLLAKMPSLQHLTLNRQYWGLLLPRIKKYVQSLTLKSLKIHGISESKEAPGGLCGPASFSDLELSDYEENAKATRALIRWPRKLRRFHFESFYNNRHYMDLTMFGNWLSIHKEALEEIYIGYLSGGSKGKIIDLSRFTALKSLTLSRYSFSDDLKSCATDASLMLAPNLETFTWSFSIYDQHCESWDAIGEKEELWLQQLAKIAASRPTPLKRIHITFDPDYWGYRIEDGYPWDRLDRVKESCRQLNIELTYTKPALTKKEWLEHVAEEERISEAQAQRERGEGEGVGEGVEEGSESEEPKKNKEGRDIREYFAQIRGTQLHDK